MDMVMPSVKKMWNNKLDRRMDRLGFMNKVVLRLLEEKYIQNS